MKLDNLFAEILVIDKPQFGDRSLCIKYDQQDACIMGN
jgi:hypothetical protein